MDVPEIFLYIIGLWPCGTKLTRSGENLVFDRLSGPSYNTNQAKFA